MDKSKVRKNIDLTETAVKHLKLRAFKSNTNVKNLIEQIVEDNAKPINKNIRPNKPNK